jgi:AcrR family transcriptional regulator
MSRPAHARTAVLAAAEAIVKEVGAAHLTFDELVRRSGITRGGITYHFPTKDALLAALVAHDLQRWRDCIADKRRRHDGPNADLLAYLDSGSEPDEETARLCAGLLGATSTQKSLDDPWRDHFAAHWRTVRASGDPALAAVLTLAVEGLFWMEVSGLQPWTADERARLVERLLAMAAAIPASGGGAPRG